MIKGECPISENQIQAASLDLRLGIRVFSMKAAGLPAPDETVEEYIKKCSYDSAIMGSTGQFTLSPGVCYIVPLAERLSLSPNHYATFSPKSSIGRCGVFVRVITDKYTSYDRTPYGYDGPLYLEITSFSFRVSVIPDISLVQMRIVEGEEKFVSAAELNHLHACHGVLFGKDGEPLPWEEFTTKEDRLLFHIDLSRDIVGFEAVETASETLHLYGARERSEVTDYWRPIHRPVGKQLILPKGEFVLLATKEFVSIPDGCCAEVEAYDLNLGEYRTHFAGFFDNGFGGDKGTVAVLELHLMSSNFRFFDGQIICSFTFQKTDHIPDKLYGAQSGSHYMNRGPSLSKFFRNKDGAWK